MDAMGQTVTALDCRNDAETMVLALLGVPTRTRPASFDAKRRSILTRTVERDVIPAPVARARDRPAADAARGKRW